MLRIEINPTRIERVIIEARSEMEHDFDTATLITLQPHLRRINRDLAAPRSTAGPAGRTVTAGEHPDGSRPRAAARSPANRGATLMP